MACFRINVRSVGSLTVPGPFETTSARVDQSYGLDCIDTEERLLKGKLSPASAGVLGLRLGMVTDFRMFTLVSRLITQKRSWKAQAPWFDDCCDD